MDERRKTVRGLETAEVERRLSEPFPEDAFENSDYSNIEYLSVESIEGRLDEVVGKLSYDLCYTEPKVITEVSGKITVSVLCSFTLYADDGTVVCRRAFNGAADVNFTKDGAPKDKAMQSCISAAQSNALKKVGAGLGVGIAQLREKNFVRRPSRQPYGQPQGQQAAQGAAQSRQRDNPSLITVCSTGTPYRNDKVIKVPVQDQSGAALEFVCFREKFPVIEQNESIDSFCRRIGQGSWFSFYGRVYADRNGKRQLVLERPA